MTRLWPSIIPCPRCKGEGFVRIFDERRKDDFSTVSYFTDKTCEACDGLGFVAAVVKDYDK